MLDERFTNKFTVCPKTNCWLWQATTVWGYGYYQLAVGRQVRAHRYAYEQLVGAVPEGLELDHKCENKRCVNPKHLEPVTHRVNCLRGKCGQHNANKTHCLRGHEYTLANTNTTSVGSRQCKECGRQRARKAYARAKREKQ